MTRHPPVPPAGVKPGAAWLLAAFAAAGLCVWAAWPGCLVFDSVGQYRQALSGRYDDWHPPAMARLWSLFVALGWRGAAPMLLLQMAAYWSGIGLACAALARVGARVGAAGLLALAFFPPLLDWMGVIDKDAQLAAAMVFASGIVIAGRIGGKPLGRARATLVAALLLYAVLLRANAAFAVVPLALGWCGWLGVRRPLARAALLLGALAGVFLVSPAINHRLLGADASHVERTLPIFDLAGIGHYAGLADIPGAPAGAWAETRRAGCYTPFYWDPFGDPKRCGTLGDALAGDDGGRTPLFRDWIAAIAHHPLAYAEHRLAHLNANLRLIAPADELSTAAPVGSPSGSGDAGAAASSYSRTLAALTSFACAIGIAAPIVWFAACASLGWALAGAPDQPARSLGLASAVSACLMTLSFAVVSIASDLRYHLWLFAGTLLTAALTCATRDIPAGRLRMGAVVTLAVLGVVIAARLTLTGLPM